MLCCFIVAVAAVCVLGAVPARAGPPAGSLVQLEGKAGCISSSETDACEFVSGFEFVIAVVVTPDGRNVYVGSSHLGPLDNGSLTAFSRELDGGALARLAGSDGCVSQLPRPECRSAAGIGEPSAMAVSPDGRFLYVATSDVLFAPASLAVFKRNVATGSLRWLACFGEAAGCSPWRAGSPDAIAITPSGAQLFVLSASQRLTVFDRNRRTGLIRQHRGQGGCVTPRPRPGCLRAHGPFPWELTVTPDARSVIGLAGDQDCVGSGCFEGGDGSLTVFVRTRAGGLKQLGGRAGCLSWQKHRGCAQARALESASDLAVSPDGRSVYVASFSFASDHDAIAVFRRNRASGQLRQLPGKAGCIAKRAVEGCARGRALDNPISVAVSPDGRNVYSIQNFSSGAAVFARGHRGALRQLNGPYGCITRRGQQGCARARGLRSPSALAISADGRNVYLVSDNDLGSLIAFRRVAARRG
jgi:DNA-binding beta-propeller fold protein YncE